MSEQIQNPILWNKKETAAYLRKSVRTVSRLLFNGQIRGFKLGRSVLIYAGTVTEDNLNAIKPKFLTKKK